jgi:glycosyltransferase involved in cell wall biosynthesis
MFPEYSSGLANQLYTSLVSTAARGSAHVITLSESAKIDIEQYLEIPEQKISATYLAQGEQFHPLMGKEKDEAIREKYDLPEQFVLYLGGFDRRKQVNEVLLAYTYVGEAEGDNIPLVIAGKEPEIWGRPPFPSNLREYAQELNIQDYVRWLGYIPEEDKPSLYRLADVYVTGTMYEGFGLTPLEAMASGTPVVAFDIDVLNEVLGEGAFLVNSAREMAGAIVALLLQQPLRETMVNQGLAQASQFSWRKTAQQTLRIYEYVMSL